MPVSARGWTRLQIEMLTDQARFEILFGGTGVRYVDCLAWNREHNHSA